jgi:hypothetical protein
MKEQLFEYTTLETETRILEQGCKTVSFQTKNPNLGKFWNVLELKMLVYFMTIWNNLRPFGLINGGLA